MPETMPPLPANGQGFDPSPAQTIAGLSIRVRRPSDAPYVALLQRHAFGPGARARAAFRIRERIAPDPDLALIAELDGQPAGSVDMTPVGIGGVDGFLLGPLATEPAFRNRGVGRALVVAACRLALAGGQGRFVLLVGDAPYYGPLGFALAKSGGIVFPGPVDPSRILVHWGDGRAEPLSGEIGPASCL